MRVEKRRYKPAYYGLTFSEDTKQYVREAQHGKCHMCGVEKPLQIHHRKRRSDGGTRDRSNAVGLCNDCHKIVDKQAIEGKTYPQVHF